MVLSAIATPAVIRAAEEKVVANEILAELATIDDRLAEIHQTNPTGLTREQIVALGHLETVGAITKVNPYGVYSKGPNFDEYVARVA